MSNNLSNLTNKELWRLFPIIIYEHDIRWANYYEVERLNIEDAIGKNNIVRMNHYGSTSV